jgi:cyclohexyl-isocyanide hydratase
MIIGMPVYDGVDLLDVAGPHEMFNWMKQSLKKSGVEIEVRLTATKPGTVKTLDGFVFQAPHCFEDPEQFDVLWVPGALLQRCWRVGILGTFGAKGFRFSWRERIMPFKILWGGG